jgi:hypothetical protein
MGIRYWEVRAYQYPRFTRIFQAIRREEHLASRYEPSSPGSIPSVLFSVTMAFVGLLGCTWMAQVYGSLAVIAGIALIFVAVLVS